MDHGVLVRLAGRQDHLALPLGHVDRVRELLRLEAQAGVLRVDGAALAHGLSIQEVARVELHARLVCLDRHRAARRGVVQLGDGPHLVRVAVDHEVVIEADRGAAGRDQIFADDLGLREVERSAGDRPREEVGRLFAGFTAYSEPFRSMVTELGGARTGRGGATTEPACFTCVPRTSFNAAWTR